MDSVNASSAVPGSSPSFAPDYASAIGSEIDDQGDLFAALLSQAQFVPQQPPAPSSANQAPNPASQNVPAAQNLQQSPPPSPSAQQPQNNATGSTANANGNANNTNSAAETNTADDNGANNANGADNAVSSNNSNAANNPTGTNSTNSTVASGQTNDSNDDSNSNSNNTTTSPVAAPQTAGPPLTEKSSRRQSKTNTGKTTTTSTTANAADGKKSRRSPTVTLPIANQTANNTIPNSGTNDSAPAANDQNTGTDPTANAALTADVGPNAGAAAGAASADPAPSNNGPTGDLVLNAGLILNADPKTGSTSDSAGNNDNSDVDPTTPANDSTNDGVMPSHLMMLLMQLEHLAAVQTPTQTTSANLPVASSNVQASDTSGTQQTTTPTGDQGKIDLKALMTAIARLDNGAIGDENSDSQSNDDVTNIAQNTASPSSSTPSSQNATPAWGNGSSNTDAKWISPDFLNLFSLPASNPNSTSTSPASPILLDTSLMTQTTASGNDGAALDSDTQGQTNAGVRDSALLSNTNSLPPATGPTQAASPYDFASQLSALRATQGGSTGLPSPVDQVILQLSRNLSSNNGNGSSQMSIQLKPAELGRVDVKLTISNDGKVQGTVTADNPSTLNLLLKDVRGLERALQEAGLHADSGSLQFGLRGDGQANGGSGQAAGNSSAFADDSDSLSGATAILPGFADSTETYYLTPGGVNMRV